MAGTVRGTGVTEVGDAEAERVRVGRPAAVGGTGLRVVAGPVRPAGERGGVRGPTRTAGPLTGAPPLRRDAVRPGARPVQPRVIPRRPMGSRLDQGARPAPGEGPVRLTRRGWCALSALVLGVAALMVLALSAVLSGSDDLTLAGGSSVVVQPGDTVWSIAAAVAEPGEDVRTVVDVIEDLNDLEGSVVVPGQVLEVP